MSRTDLALTRAFRIAGHVFTDTPVVTATVRSAGASGRGEAAGVYYCADTADAAAETLRGLAGSLPSDLDRHALRSLLPPGGARNALDCALWEFEAREAGRHVWELAGMPAPRPLLTTLTLGAEPPGEMAQAAVRLSTTRALKLKLDGDVDQDLERVRAVRRARPDVWLAVDANQGYSTSTIERLIPVLVDARVALLEQPFARGAEADLEGAALPLPIAADESCLHLGELDALVGRFDVVNVKLDKCGGLTEGLMMAQHARRLGLQVMVGNMTGTSLCVAPAFVLGQLCDVVDLDAPLFIAEDPPPTATYIDGHVDCPPQVWGLLAVHARQAAEAFGPPSRASRPIPAPSDPDDASRSALGAV
ncbi:MAG: dipeptide epimerase [Pseudomonadota bacterium]